MTNADRIRSMTNEELAEWGATLPCCPPGPDVQELCFPEFDDCGGDGTLSRKCWLNWLKQEVKE